MAETSPGKYTDLEIQLNRGAQQHNQQVYQEMMKEVKPKPRIARDCLGAFLVGGTISLAGQLINSAFLAGGLPTRDAASATIMVMIFLGALLTGLGIYDSIARFAGAGSIVPVTGFANSIVAPAMEFKREGFVFGVAARMFNVAGPVLVYGIVVSVIIGLIAFFFAKP